MIKKLKVFIALVLLIANQQIVLANSCQNSDTTVVTYSVKADRFSRSKTKKKSDEVYVRISKADLKELRRQSLLSFNLLQRIRDLEKLYRNIENIVNTVVEAIDLIKQFINYTGLDLDFSGNKDDFEHLSGVVMSPGFVEFTASVYDPEKSFDEVGLNSLFMDIYYNRNLFSLDHIEGDGVAGVDYKNISLAKKYAAYKQRIELPISDVLSSNVKFRVCLAPLNPDLIQVGDKSSIKIKYYKRVPKNANGQRIAPVSYDYAATTPREIIVKVK